MSFINTEFAIGAVSTLIGAAIGGSLADSKKDKQIAQLKKENQQLKLERTPDKDILVKTASK